MSYEATTPHLGLPQWVYTDKPQMTDFNAAFSAIDSGTVKADDYAHPIAAGTAVKGAAGYTLTLDPPLPAYVPGMVLCVNFDTAHNASAGSTGLNINGLGIKYLFVVGSNVTPSFAAGHHLLMYDGTYWRLLDAVLPITGGTMYGSIKPNPTSLINLGDVAAYWNYVYGVHGRFRDELKLGSHDVWHEGNLAVYADTLTLTGAVEVTNRALIRRIGDVVTLVIHARYTSISADMVFATLPVQYRPAATTVLTGMVIRTGGQVKRTAQQFILNTDGTLKVADGVTYDNANYVTEPGWIALSCSYII